MSKLTVQELAEVMYRSRLQYEGHDQETIDQMVIAAMAGPTIGQVVNGSHDDTLDFYFEEAEFILDWINDNEPEARAIAGLLLRTSPEFKFNDGLILDALIERRQAQFIIGEDVILTSIPIGLLDGLPEEDQEAIKEIVGKPVKFIGHSSTEDIEAILEFTDEDGDVHTIWVDLGYVKVKNE